MYDESELDDLTPEEGALIGRPGDLVSEEPVGPLLPDGGRGPCDVGSSEIDYSVVREAKERGH